MAVRLFSIALVCCLLSLTTGCLTIFSKTEIRRGDEQRLPVQFQTGRAGRLFYDEVARRDKNIGGSHIGIPFVTFYTKNVQLSDNALFNDQVRICDTNQDGVITEEEASIYANAGTVDPAPVSEQIQPASYSASQMEPPIAK